MSTSGVPRCDRAHLLGVLDLGFEGLDAMMRAIDALREGRDAPLGAVVGTQVELAERHVRCGVRDGVVRAGCSAMSGSWDELAASVSAPEHDPSARRPDVLVGVDGDHARLERLAGRLDVPVLNAGTNRHQPLLVLADLVTLRDFLGPLGGRHLLLVEPDLALRRSWAEACVLTGMRCTVVPPGDDDVLGVEFADAVAAAALFGTRLQPWDGGVAHASPAGERAVDIVVGTPRPGTPAAAAIAATEGDVVVLPAHVAAEDAAPGRARSDAARAVLYHRSQNITLAVAALLHVVLGSRLAR